MTQNVKTDKILITGAAGLVGQNLVVEMRRQGYSNIVALDKHMENLEILKTLNENIQAYCVDLAEPLPEDILHLFDGVACLVILHAQITSKARSDFIRNNIEATQNVLEAAKKTGIQKIVHVSSSVVVSVAKDDYTETKKIQEEMVLSSSISNCVLRPTLMFGWFDPKHLGWLSRFMAVVPVFPIPGDGKFMRQPLYERDFCRCLIKCIEEDRSGKIYDIVGATRIDYVDIIKAIKKVKRLHTLIVHIPIGFFAWLLKTYAIFSKKPPFTADQLKALIAGDDFHGVDTIKEFGVKQTDFHEAIRETFVGDIYSRIVLKR